MSIWNLFSSVTPAAQPSPSMSLLGMDPSAIRQQALYQGLLGLGSGLLQAGARSTDPGNQARGVAMGLQGFQGGLMSGQQRALQQMLIQKQLNAPTISKPGDIARGPDGKELWRNPEKAPDGFQYVEGPNGQRALQYIPGGPADPAVVGLKAAAEAEQRARFNVTPLQPGAGFVVGVPGVTGAGAMPAPSPAPGQAALPPQMGSMPPRAAPVDAGAGPRPFANVQPAAPPPGATTPVPMLRQPSGVRNPMEGGPTQVAPGVFATPSPTENAFDREYGQGSAKRALELEDNGNKARSQADNYRRFLMYQDAVKTGKLAPAATEVAAFMEAFGIDPKSVGFNPAAPAQALEALTNKLVQGNIGGEGGMPANSFSNADREFIQKIEPSLRNTPGANRLIAEANIRVAERTALKADKWLEARDSGKTWLQFEREWRQFSSANPVFGDDFKAMVDEVVKAGKPDPDAARGAITPADNQQPIVKPTYRYDPKRGLVPN